MTERRYSAEEVDAAVAARGGGAIAVLMTEESRVAMLVGVAVGLELAAGLEAAAGEETKREEKQ
jgi:hypothetical protein